MKPAPTLPVIALCCALCCALLALGGCDSPEAQPDAGAMDAALSDGALPPWEACRNLRDDDGDGLIDRADPGCTSATDDDEQDPDERPSCANGLDDDGDGAIDLDDDGCDFAGQSEGRRRACGNGIDDDGDGRVDADDPGCRNAGDDSEDDPETLPACANGIDDDADGFVDRADPDCAYAGHGEEGPAAACANRIDDDRDQRVDVADPGCTGPGDDDETDPERLPTCADGLDNDRDGRVDREDDDCPYAGLEEGVAPLCSNGLDDDGDGLIDTVDPGCVDVDDDDEADPPAPPGCANGLDDDGDGAIDRADEDCVYAGAAEGPAVQCSDGLDGDDDGLIDRDDPGCAGPDDDDEVDPAEPPGCANGLDDDLDGAVDRDDPDCAYAGAEEGAPPVCADGRDNDGDGRIDDADPGCTDEHDFDERDPAEAPVCANGLDDDGDGRVDYPDDPDCPRAGAGDEGRAAACANGFDDDGDGRADRLDPGCVDGADDDEADPPAPPACANGIDDDGDGRVDFPADPDCLAAGGGDEGRPRACVNGLDDDGDGLVDRDDPGCAGRGDDDEADPPEPPACANGLDDDLDGAVDLDDPDCAAAGGAFEGPTPACANDIDDDLDGLVDRVDPGCSRDDDDDERDPPQAPGCADGIDNDLDGAIDGDDADCVAAGAEEGPAPACANGLDDDGDGLLDAADPGCAAPRDDDEADPAAPPACADGFDNDGDGAVDRADPGCPFAGGDDEGPQPACANGLDDDGDGLLDADDPGCAAAADGDERDPPAAPACANGLDDDGDGRVDRDDPDCTYAGFDDEGARPACANGLDDDGDGAIDGADPGCLGAFDDDERDPPVPPSCANGLDDDGDGLTDREDDDCRFAGAAEDPAPACANGLDDDGDGRIDVVDPGCRDTGDDDELDPPMVPVCANGLDDDEDGAVDFPEDADCRAAGGEREAPAAPCANGLDDDGDGATDRFDPGCASPLDDDEADPAEPPACANGLDDDADGAIDYPADPGCVAAGSDDEGPVPACADGLDNNSNGRIDLADTGCTDPSDDDETRPFLPPVCANGRDDDADGLVDYPEDPGCVAAGAGSEGPRVACTDGLDNDGDGRVDLADPGCADRRDADEADPPQPPACANGLDDDGDGAIDYPADPNCTAAGVDDEAFGAVCADGLDNDGDGLSDDDDPGCADPFDIDEADVFPRPRCANRVDDDRDGLVDYPDDPDCPRAGAEAEGRICAGVQRIAVGLVDAARVELQPPAGDALLDIRCGAGAGRELIVDVALAVPGRLRVDPAGAPVRISARTACADRFSERACGADGEPFEFDVDAAGTVSLLVQWQAPGGAPFGLRLEFDDGAACGNGRDDDGDGRIDLFDPGCVSLADLSERDPRAPPTCANGIDDDGDGAIDYPADRSCAAAGREETPHPCPDLGGQVIAVEGRRTALVLEYGPGWPQIRARRYAQDLIRLTVDAPSQLRIGHPDRAARLFTVQTGCETEPLNSRLGDGMFATYVAPGEYLIIVGPDGDAPLPQQIGLIIEVEPVDTLPCANGLDDDGDGRIDAADPGCNWRGDDSEIDPLQAPGCADGRDDDGDGAVDFPADPDCVAAGRVERPGACGYDRPVGPPLRAGHNSVRWPSYAALRPFAGVDGPCARPFGYLYPIPLHIEQTSRLVIRDADVIDPHTLLVRRDCEDPESEVICLPPRNEQLIELPPGDYTLFALDDESRFSNRIAVTVEPAQLPFACDNGVDDDGDGAVDLDDIGCLSIVDDDEADPDGEAPPVCADGIDNDADGRPDYPLDPQCSGAGDHFERATCDLRDPALTAPLPFGESRQPFVGDRRRPGSACGEGGWFVGASLFADLDAPALVDVRVDGLQGEHRIDFQCPRRGCLRGDVSNLRLEPGDLRIDVLTRTPDDAGVVTVNLRPARPPACANGRDDDGDGQIDALDPGCLDAADDDEADPARAPVCADGVDNDGDGAIDFPDDSGCDGPGGPAEGQRCPEGVPQIDLGAAGGLAEFDDVRHTAALRLGCNPSNAPRAVATIDVEVPSRLTVAGSSRNPVLRRHCGQSAEITCDAREVPVVRRGSYAIIGHFFRNGPATLDVGLEPLAALDRACLDGIDSDGDGLIDLDDPGCSGPGDADEADDGPAPCANGLDDDGDGAVDFPDDPDCDGAGDSEAPVIIDAQTRYGRIDGFVLPLGAERAAVDIWLPRGGVLRAETVDSLSYDPTLSLLDGDGREMIRDRDGGPDLDARIETDDLPPGRYTLQVTPTAAIEGASTTLRVEVEPLPIP